MKLVWKSLLWALGGLAAFTAAAIYWYPTVDFAQYTVEFIIGGTIALAVLTVVALVKEDVLSDRGKTILMVGFLFAVLVPSVYVTGAYIHQVATSWSDGEIHWHADYEVVVQNETDGYEQLDLIDPSRFCEETTHESSYMCRLSDRTGAVEFHEHDDRRIHLEGTFRDREEATLQAFFRTFGGSLANNYLKYPTNERMYELRETGDRTLKIAVQRGVAAGRHWCMIETQDNIDRADICRSEDTEELATSPDKYVISPYQRGPIDTIFIVYDDASPQRVLNDLREDGEYRGYGVVKTSGGY